MSGYSPKLPLVRDKIDGAYALNKGIMDVVKQNFKMLMLTSPGEKMMDPTFGVGLRNYLFKQDIASLRSEISNKIVEQTRKYLNYINISEIIISPPESNDYNTLYISIRYFVNGINASDTLNLEIY